MANENLLDIVERLDHIVTDLKAALYGSPEARSSGLFVEFDTLRLRVATLEKDVEFLKARRPNSWVWAMGFAFFIGGAIFGTIALMKIPNNFWDIPVPLAAALAAFFTGGSLLMFLIGFGWLDRR